MLTGHAEIHTGINNLSYKDEKGKKTMIRKMLVLFLLLPLLASCGWKTQCTKRATYDLEKEKISMVGSEMVQTGCFSARSEPTGINKDIFRIQPQENGYYFQPIVENELIYSGRSVDTLHLTYREYTVRGYARPAFSQNVFYDMKASDIITFQGWALQVLEADNQKIRFKVIGGPVLDEWYY